MTAAARRALGRKPRVVVVEQDQVFREEVLRSSLQRLHFEVEGVANARELYRSMLARSFDILLLDARPPDESALSVASYLRRHTPAMGIVMLGNQVSERERRESLKAGVDAYLSKPLDGNLLTGTLRNLLRWITQTPAATGSTRAWRLDETGWRLHAPNGVEIPMSLAERQVILRLSAAAGAPVSRENLIATISDDPDEFDPHRLEMLVYRLRKRCRQRSGQALPLHAVRGVGYALSTSSVCTRTPR